MNTPENAYQILKIFITRERHMREIIFANNRIKQAAKLNACDNALNALEILKPKNDPHVELFPEFSAEEIHYE